VASVAFLRGVNVGGHKTFRPAVLARELVAFDVVNVGAAGTFVVRKTTPQATLLAELRRRLPFEAEIIVCRAREVLDLARRGPFADEPTDKRVSRFVTVMAKRPRTMPRLPLYRPAGDGWQVKIVAVSGKFALSLWRRTGRTVVYPNEIVEKNFGVSATTRNWNTIATICDILHGG
jgi:uncharacterized protein (DUF1697 family)